MPTINIRWADNTAELRARLREGVGALDAMRSSVDKTVQAMGGQGLFKAAHNVTAAIIEMGGATKLTVAEQQRHLTLLDKAIEKYRVMGQTAPAAMKQVADEMRRLADASGFMEKHTVGATDFMKKYSVAATPAVAVTKDLSGAMGLAAKALGAFGIGLGVGAVANFGKAILADADALVKMSDKTGVSLQGLQKFQIAADDAGNTIEQLTSATNQMQNRMAGGDQSALAAIQKLGLSLKDLKALEPDQQFMAIADAIRGIQDPAEQVNVAMDIFGKSGAEILPTIKRGFDDVKDAAVGMSDETVKALDDVGDAWNRAVRETKANVGGLIAFLLPGLERAWMLANLLAGRGGTRFVNAVTPDLTLPTPAGSPNFGTAPAIQPIEPPPNLATAEMFLSRMTRTTGAARASAKAVDDVANALAQVAKAEADAAEKMHDLAWGTRDTAKAMADLGKVGVQHVGMIDDELGNALLKMQAFTAIDTSKLKFDLGALFDMGKVKPPSTDDLKPLLTPFQKSFAQLPNLLVQSFTGGGGAKGAFNALGATIGSGLFGEDGPFKNAVAKSAPGLTKIFGKGIGGAMAAAIPGIGAMIGPALSALWGGLKKLFGGPSQQELEGRDVKAKFQESFGGFEKMLGTIAKAYEATGRTADMARKDVERLIAAEKQGADAVKAVIADINKAFEEQQAQAGARQTSVAALNAFTEKGIESLGKFNIATASAVALFGGLVKETGDVAGALEQLGPTLDALIKAEKDLGLEGNAAVQQLLGLRKVTQEQKPLMDNIAQSTALLKGLGQAGLLTNQNIIAFGQNAVNQFTLLKGATGDAKSAMVLMQPELQLLWQHQEKFGKFADEATEALVNQAKEAGIVGPDMKSDQDKLLGVMKEIRDTLMTIAGIEIPDKTFKVTPEIDPIVVPDVPDFPTRGPIADYASTGGRMTPFGIVHGLRAPQYLSTGGLAGMSSIFQPRGTDTQAAMLTVGEVVSTAPQWDSIQAGLDQRAVVAELRRIGSKIDGLADRPDTVVQIDGREIAKATVKAWDNGTSLTDAREVLGVP